MSGFGKVFEAVKKNGDPSEKFAIKEISQAGSELGLREAARMARHDHKNLMALIEFYQFKQGGLTRCFLVMHLCRPGSLTAMQKDVIFDEVHALYVMKEITAGLVYLHAQLIIHRDLKSANVLVNQRSEVKIADFGISADSKIGFVATGTPGFAAPEQLGADLGGVRGVYTQKADVYPVAVTGIDCLLPQSRLPTDFRKLNKVESEAFAPTQLARVERERKMVLSQEFKDVVTACLSTQTARPTAKKVLDMPAIKNAPLEPFKALVALCIKNQEDRWNGIHGREGAPPTPSTLFPTHKQRVGQSSSGGQSTSPSMSLTAFLERKKRAKRDDSSTFATSSTPFATRKRKTAQSTSPSSASATASTVFPAHKRKRGETSSASATSSDD